MGQAGVFSRRRGRLLKTGQTTSYGSGTGVDDGALQKGLAKSYTVLDAGQYAGTTNITINGKTDAHANACVFDNQTGLMWSRTSAASVGPASDGKLPWTTTGSGATAEGIFPYAAAANAASLSGYSDWRVPNLFELISIMDIANFAPDSTAWPSWPGNWWDNYHWTSSGISPGTPYSYGITGDIIINPLDPATNHYLLLVRGG